MVVGRHGHNGRHVAATVVLGFRLGHVNAVILQRNMEGYTVMDFHLKQENAIQFLVQVNTH